jgi:hypothetical protein
MYKVKSLDTMEKDSFIIHLYLKYQSPNKFGSKEIAQVNFFQNEVKIQDQSHKLKIKVTRSKVLVPKERSLHNASISKF